MKVKEKADTNYGLHVNACARMKASPSPDASYYLCKVIRGGFHSLEGSFQDGAAITFSSGYSFPIQKLQQWNGIFSGNAG
jgi:hypothetical protein